MFAVLLLLLALEVDGIDSAVLPLAADFDFA
jgi:hypothetical protein